MNCRVDHLAHKP